MERAPDLQAFVRAPLGRFVAGTHWLCFNARASLWGVVLFGRPDRDDAVGLTRAFDVELLPAVPRHAVLVDARALESIDAGAFEVLQSYARENLRRSSEKVERLGLVLPPGVSGAVVAGFYGVLGAPCPVECTATRGEALAWLGEPSLEPLVAEALATVQGAPPLLGALRALLRGQLAEPDVAGISVALGLSERTLQRRLSESGTSFQREVTQARLDEAQRRLAESHDAVTVIAVELGFASSQHFSRLFRRATGMTPSQFRLKNGR
jgi:AraC-like DNA-binding protein